MFTHKLSLAAFISALVFAHPASAQVARYGFGTPATPDELAKYFSIPADGRGLPSGSGNAKKGAELYALACAACHGEKL
jgi:cytochrome c